MHCLFGLLHAGEVFFGKSGGQAVELFECIVDGVQSRLPGFGVGAIGVAAHLEPCLLQQFFQLDHAVELRQAVALQQSFFDLCNVGDGTVSRTAELCTAGFASLNGQAGIGERLFVLSHCAELLLDQNQILRGGELLVRQLQRLVQCGQLPIYLCVAFLTLVPLIVQARNSQVFGQPDDL